MFKNMKKRDRRPVRALLLLLCLLLLAGMGVQAKDKKGSGARTFVKAKTITRELLDSMDLKNVTRLMVVAHPDDETLWGGGHLLQADYLVVCLTNADTYQYGSRRAEEFRQVMKKTGDRGIIMYYPDYTGATRTRDSWRTSKASIRKDLKTLLKYKNWTEVVTYDKAGAYGHQHHKMTCSLVTECFRKYGPKGCSLIYFGKYYKRAELQRLKRKPQALPKNVLKKKKEALKLYQSQNVRPFRHMFPYEDWTTVLRR